MDQSKNVESSQKTPDFKDGIFALEAALNQIDMLVHENDSPERKKREKEAMAQATKVQIRQPSKSTNDQRATTT